MEGDFPTREQLLAEVAELRRRLAEYGALPNRPIAGALPRSDLKNAETLRMAQPVYWEYDPLSDQFSFSDSFYRMLGLTATEAGGYTMKAADFVRRFVHPNWISQVSEMIRQAIASDSPAFENQAEAQLLTAQQEPLWVTTSLRVEKNAAGQSVRLYGFNQDITARRQAEEALRQSEARYRHITATLTDYMYTVQVVNGQPAETRHGPGCVAITGYTPEAFAADPYLWFRMVVPEDRPQVQAQAQQVLTGSAPVLEHRLIRKDGAERWVRNTPVPFYDQLGRLTGYDGLIQDITERHQAEEAQRAAHNQLVTITDSVPVLIAQFSLDRRYVYVNEPHARFFGKPPAHLVGRHVRDVIGEAGYAVAEPYIERVLQGEAVMFENVVPNADGEPRATLVQYTPHRDGEGRLIGYLTLIQDITERKQAEQALRESEIRYQETLEYLPAAIALTTSAGENVYFNQAFTRLYGYTRDDLPTLNDWWQRAYPDPAYRSEVQAAWAESMTRAIREGAATEAQEARVTCKDGRQREVALRTRLVGELYIISAVDITERKEMETALRNERALLAERVEARTAELQQANADLVRASRLKDEFLANMSHELRTPLTAILGLTEALQLATYGPVPDNQIHILQVVRQSGQHLLALISDILDLSKIEAGKLEVQLAPAAVSDICQACLHVIKPQAEKKGLRLAFTPDPLVRLIMIDARRLKQMVINLLNNAVKFTPEGGQIGLEVAGDAAQHTVRFTVWDTGIGIPSEKQELLFRPFVQVDGGLARKYEGAGLGLALTRRLAEMLGGRVTVQSAGEGQGSRFIIVLPWHPADTADQLPSARAAADLATPSGRPAVILLADDNPTTLMTIGDFLQSLSATVLTAQNGHDALAQARAARPDLIMMDIQMPGLNGLETIRRLRAAPETARIPIIALTALVMPGDRERCLSAGADDYVSKPVRLEELLQSILRLIARTKDN